MPGMTGELTAELTGEMSVIARTKRKYPFHWKHHHLFEETSTSGLMHFFILCLVC